ncbi:hypothetical protein JI56_02400 [SAR11 cluster bacterium PRT-SC02]|nr:hypothetical protein JI56_02400 [SAR11 cluster bacterium PRT-SC02]
MKFFADLNLLNTNSSNNFKLDILIEKPPAILWPPPLINIFFWTAASITEPISKPTIDLAEPLPFLPSVVIIIVGLL